MCYTIYQCSRTPTLDKYIVLDKWLPLNTPTHGVKEYLTGARCYSWYCVYFMCYYVVYLLLAFCVYVMLGLLVELLAELHELVGQRVLQGGLDLRCPSL